MFEKSIEEGFLTFAHAGEEGPPEYIWDSINLLNVKELIMEFSVFMTKNWLKSCARQNTFNSLPSFKYKITHVFDDLKEHNLKKMLDEKLMVMVNSDDPAYFGGYLNKNLIEIQSALGLSIDDIKTLIINSFKSSFEARRKKLNGFQKFKIKIFLLIQSGFIILFLNYHKSNQYY